MDALDQVLRALGDSFPVIYFFALAFAITKFKQVNSTVICIALLFAMESLMNIIREPLLSLDSREAWYGTWTLLHVVTVALLYKTHALLKVNLAKITNMVALANVSLACVQTMRYMERSLFNGAFFESWYYLSVSAINVSVALIVIYSVFKEEKPVGMYVS